MKPLVSAAAHEAGLIMRLVAEAEDAHGLRRQVPKEGRVQEQRMIAIVFNVFFLQWNSGIVIVVEDRLPRFEDGNCLAMDAGGVEQERRAGGPGELVDLVEL